MKETHLLFPLHCAQLFLGYIFSNKSIASNSPIKSKNAKWKLTEKMFMNITCKLFSEIQMQKGIWYEIEKDL